jgi:predicted transcriptional regulator
VIGPPEDPPPASRASVRMDARLDAVTRRKVDDLATRFHQPRAAVLCHIMHWGLSCGSTGPLDHDDVQGPVCHLYLYVASALHARVEKAATAVGVKASPWLRHMVRRVTLQDFPTGWQEATPYERSHESRTYGMRFMLRLDGASHTKLQQLAQRCGASKAEIIRRLIAHATPEDVPPRWQLTTAARHARPAPRDRPVSDEVPTP